MSLVFVFALPGTVFCKILQCCVRYYGDDDGGGGVGGHGGLLLQLAISLSLVVMHFFFYANVQNHMDTIFIVCPDELDRFFVYSHMILKKYSFFVAIEFIDDDCLGDIRSKYIDGWYCKGCQRPATGPRRG